MSKKTDEFTQQVERLSYLLDQLQEEQEKNCQLTEQLKYGANIPTFIAPPRLIEMEQKIFNSEQALEKEQEVNKALTRQLKQLSFTPAKTESIHKIKADSPFKTDADIEIHQLEAKHASLTQKLEALKKEVNLKKAEMKEKNSQTLQSTTEYLTEDYSLKAAREQMKSLNDKLLSNEDKNQKIKRSRDLISKAEKDILTMKDKKVILEKKNQTLKKRVSELWAIFGNLEEKLEVNRALSEQVRTLQTGLGIPYNPQDLGASEIEKIRRLLMGSKYKTSVTV